MKRICLLLVLVLAACAQVPSAPSGLSTSSSTAVSSPPSITTSGSDGPVEAPSAIGSGTTILRLATTTSTADSGLLDAILPDFESRYNADVQVVAVGTGQALKLGENGDAEVVLVHARTRENEFVAQGFGVNRRDVMVNDFIIVGPQADPAGLKTATNAADAVSKIAQTEAPFASRGDDSGTFTKEQTIWATAGITPTAELSWYKSLGQGMGETLLAANELQAYTLSDRGTFLAQRETLPNLSILLGGETVAENTDRTLQNPYGVIAVNPERHQGINAALANQFIDWMVSADTQQRIGEFGKDRFGQALFSPAVR